MKTIIKDSSEWAEFSDSVCRSYGFENKFCPIVYTLEGMLIGDGKDFMEEVQAKYKLNYNNPGRDIVKQRAKAATDDNDALMRKKKDGDSVAERIENALEKLKKKKVTTLIDDA